MKQWHPQSRLEAETGPSGAGATHSGGPIPAPTRIQQDSNDFLRLGRSLDTDFASGALTFDEFGWLVLLLLKANPHNGRVRVSYQALAEESGDLFAKNKINKIFLSLLAKRYIWFEKKPGRKRPIEISLNYYPLSSGNVTNLTSSFELSTRTAPILEAPQNEEISAEVAHSGQSKAAQNTELARRFSRINLSASRGTNNDNNEEQQEYIKSLPVRSELPGSTNDHEETRIRKIATELGERDLRFIRSRLRVYDMEVIEEGYRITVKAAEEKEIENLGSYFNAVVDALGKRKYPNADFNE